MATTVRKAADIGCSAASLRLGACRTWSCSTAVRAVAAALPLLAQAQPSSLSVGVSSQLTWSSDADFEANGRSDTILDIRPRIDVRSQGARVRLSGYAAATAETSVHKTQRSRILPEADLSARLEAIERLFFVEAGVRASQVSRDPFGLRPELGASANAITTTQLRLSPIIEGTAGSSLRYRVRSDNVHTRESGDADALVGGSARGYFGRHSLGLEQLARPLGWRIEAERSQTRFAEESRPDLNVDVARAIADYAVTDELSLGLRVGRESDSYLDGDQSRSLHGAQISWRPSPRTRLAAFQEKRFFGSAWQLDFDHRMPQLALNLSSARGVDSTPQALFQLPAENNVAQLLDAMLTTRFPDAVERARLVQDYIARQGLPSSTLQPISLYSQRLSLYELHSASVALTGSRNALAFSVYQSRTRDLLDSGPFATDRPADNNQQRGASLVLSHRLTPATSLTAGLDWSRITSLDTADDAESRQYGARLQFTAQLAPKTSAFLGGRYRKLSSTVVASGRQGLAFLGLDHRF